jgi:polyisoprenyl-phosphate glycosyltransferase
VAGPERLTVVLLPVFNDWGAVSLLIPALLRALGDTSDPVGILIADDGSTAAPPEDFCRNLPRGLAWLRILKVRRNVGHQRAIAIGLCYIYDNLPCHAVVVMDADGEDRPEDVPRLLEQARGDQWCRVVFAERQRRAEGVIFKSFYLLYRLLHLLLTGASVRVGNFSVIPRQRLASLVVVSELWIHYAASVFRSRQPLTLVPTERGRRLDGKSRMNFVGLVVHGLSAISVYSDVVFTRLVVAASGVVALSAVLVAAAIAVRLLTTLAVPGWATYVVGFLVVILLQAVMFVLVLTFQVLGARQHSVVVPQRAYSQYVDAVRDVIPQP